MLSYDDGVMKMIHPENRNGQISDKKNLDGFMIGRASFGNPWCFLPGNYIPTLEEILTVMAEHGKILWEWKERKGMMEARKHLVQYLFGFPKVKEYRSRLVQVESPDDINAIIADIQLQHSDLLGVKMGGLNMDSFKITG